MRRAILLVLVAAAFVTAGATRAHAAEPEWHSEQPVAAGIEVSVPLGEVGDIEFWAPNRGLLITAGNHGMPAGLYAYDGTGWHLYSTVCGGHSGRIAWAGPDEFWTISDQRIGEEPAGGVGQAALWHRSLCHFKNGEVVASYAEPLGQANSYSQMNTAVCDGPSDCWFGGERLSGETNVGAFHLHWDGSTLSAVPSLMALEPDLKDPGRAVFDMAFHRGQLYESASVRAGDEPESEAEPSFLHRVNPGSATPFEPVATSGLSLGGPPEGLEGFRFGQEGPMLWALSGAVFGASDTPTMLRLEGESFIQVPLSGGIFKSGDRVSGFAPEPGSGYAWASFSHSGGESAGLARLAHIELGSGEGSVEDEVMLPRPEEELNGKGAAGPVACPAAGQCWMVTSKGWIFHLGGPLEQDTDPAMHQLITFRPCDEACRSGVEVGLPEDNSGAEPETPLFPEVPEYERPPTRAPKSTPIYTNLHQKLIHRTILQLTFLLHARAHVQLIAKRKKRVVAKTARLTLEKGHHQIRLRLDPRRWPTHLSFEVHRVGKKHAS